jgi:N-acetylneuraminic acid mutarotase
MNPHRSRHRYALAAARHAAAAVLALLTACGGGGGGDDGGSNPPPPPPPSPNWSDRAALPGGPRQEAPAVELNGEIYFIGGFDETRNGVADVEAYNPTTNTWRSVAALPALLHHVNAASAGGRIYVVGGLSNTSFDAVGLTYEYDPAANTWTPRTSMPAGTQRGAAATAAIDGRIYVAGGWRNGAVNDFSVYDPALDTWSPLQNMPTAREHFFAVASGTSFIAIGGRNAAGLRAEVEIYDTQTSLWTERALMPTPRGGLSGGLVNGRVHVVGGEGNTSNANGVFANHEVYDPVANSWGLLGPMPNPVHGAGTVGFNGVVYVIGGGSRQGFAAVASVSAYTPP